MKPAKAAAFAGVGVYAKVSAARFRALPEIAPLCAGRKAGVCRLQQTAARAAVQKSGGESRAFSDEDRAVLRRATKGGIFRERRTAVGGKGNKQSRKSCIGFRLGCFRLGRIQRDFCDI